MNKTRIASSMIVVTALVLPWTHIKPASAGSVFAGSSAASSPAAGITKPFRILRAVINSNGSIVAGAQGMTVSHTGTGAYKITFAKGTWNTSTGTSCYFVAQVQDLFTGTPVNINNYLTNADGSGEVDYTTGSTDQPSTVMATSANC